VCDVCVYKCVCMRNSVYRYVGTVACLHVCVKVGKCAYVRVCVLVRVCVCANVSICALIHRCL
jgi:hypothetical protein